MEFNIYKNSIPNAISLNPIPYIHIRKIKSTIVSVSCHLYENVIIDLLSVSRNY